MKIKQNIIALNLSLKKEIIKVIIFTLIPFAIFLFLFFFLKFNYLFLGLAIAVLIILPLLLFLRYPMLLKKQKDELREEFKILMGYYRVYLDNGFNPYQSFQSLLPFALPSLQEKIEEFLEAVDQDKSVEPYIKLASYFKDDTTQHILISIYQISINGYSQNFFTNFSNSNKELKKITNKNIKEKFKESLLNLTIIPLIAAGLVTVILALGILQVIGGMISGF